MRMGIITVIHTFGSDLRWHPHIHLIVTGGGLTLDGERWIETDPRYLMNHSGLKKRWKYHVMKLMKKAHRQRRFRLWGKLEKLREYRYFAGMLNRLWPLTWYAHIGAGLLDPEHSVRYAGRYTKRAVLAEYRITYYDGKIVRYAYQDYANGGKTSYRTLKVNNFIKRLIRHIPDKGFPMVRHSGIFCNRWKKRYLRKVFRPGQYFVDSDRRCCHDSVINHRITMSSPRILGEPSRETNYYHTMSRIIERRFVFKNPVAAAKLRQIIFNQAAMSGVRVLTYTIMSNHFHLLLAVDEPEENRKKLDDEAILKRLSYVTRQEPLMEIRQTLQLLKQHSPERAYLEYRRRLLARMWDLSVFMKEVKQRFSQWFNRRQHRRGPVWEDRFKSVLVEGEEHLLTAMAAYIDLNAVRAGIVGDPKEYRWCGYAEAVAGNVAMQSGLQEACGSAPGSDWSSCQADYRMRLVGTGEEGEELADLRTVGKRTRAGMRRQLVRKVMQAEGQLSWPTLLRCRIRYFTDGKVIGRRAFLEEVFARNRERMGVKREVGARRPRGLKLGDDWRTLTDLRGQVVL